jgi:hypothetical protein
MEIVTRYFTIGDFDEKSQCADVFYVDGKLRAHDQLVANLYSVEGGVVREVSSISVTAVDAVFGFLSRPVEVRFALCEGGSPSAPRVVLGAGGRHSRAAGHGTWFEGSRPHTNSKVLSAALSHGRASVAYVEGDVATAHLHMDVASFATVNSHGNYLVITVGVFE